MDDLSRAKLVLKEKKKLILHEIDEKINKVRSDTVDLLEEANKMLSNI